MKYQCKKTHVKAFMWTGGPEQTEDPKWICKAISNGKVAFSNSGTPEVTMSILNKLSVVTVSRGDYVVYLDDNNIIAMKEDIFTSIYGPVPKLDADI